MTPQQIEDAAEQAADEYIARVGSVNERKEIRYDFEKGYFKGFTDAMPTWVDVKDSLPQEGTYVLTILESGEPCVQIAGKVSFKYVTKKWQRIQQ